MYAKVFAQIYDGSLCTRGPWEALVTFQQMLVLADQDGAVDMTADAISRRTTIPLDIIERGIVALLLPDPQSRTPDEDGRRILPLTAGRTWGWQVVNYKHYRQMQREQDRREYHRDYWHKRKHSTDSTPLKSAQANQPIAEAEAEAEALKAKHYVKTDGFDAPQQRKLNGNGKHPPPCPYEALIEAYHQTLPALPQAVVLTAARKAHMQARWREVWLDERFTHDGGVELFRGYFGRVAQSKFLTGGAKVNGDGRKPFRASLDWLMKPENFAKVIEGRYDA